MNRRDFLKVGVAAAATGTLLPGAEAQSLTLKPGTPISVSRVGPIQSGQDSRAVGRFEKLELTFEIATEATNLQLPYDPRPAAWSGDLKDKEDATQGVSVDALLLSPGQHDWSKALVHPCFLYRPYRSTPLPVGLPFNNTETLVATGRDVWTLRFAPTLTGDWRVRVRVTDAGGQNVTPESQAFLFFCVPSSKRGFMRVSPTDSRYFAFDNGSPCDLIGQNIFPKNWDEMRGAVDSITATGAAAILRLWIASRSGQEIVGGWANSAAGRYFGYFGTGSGLTSVDTHSGRYAFDMPGDGGINSAELSLKPDTAYTFSFWARLRDGASPAPVRVMTQDSYTYANTQEHRVEINGAAWARYTFPFTAHDPQSGNDYRGAFKIEGRGGGHVLIDDIQLIEDATGADVCEVGDFDRHVQYNLKQSWLLDNFLDYADVRGHCVRLNCLEDDDDMFCGVGSDARPSPHSAANFYSNSTDPNADTPVRRWHQYYARYLAARWGYSTAVAQFEFCNESDFGLGAGSWAAARNFARAIHSYNAHGRRLCSTSFYQNSGGSSYNAGFWDDPTNTDMDYADVHNYPAGGVAYLPGGSGFTRLDTGGPHEMGRLHIDDTLRAGQSQVLEMPIDRLRGAGTWKIEYDVRADGSAQMNWFNRGPDMGLFSNNDGSINNINIPGSDGGRTAPPLPAGFDWQHRSSTFQVTDKDARQARLVVNCAGLSGGAVDFAGIRVTAPTGRTWAYYPFNEPRTDHDTASFAQYLGLMYTSYSGDPSIGKPLTIGETDLVTAQGYDTDFQRDTEGVYMRQFCWAHLNPSGGTVFLYTNAGGWAMGHGFYRYAAAYQRFLKSIPFDNGRYRHIEAGVSDPRVIVIGQKDIQAGRAHFYAYNRDANWHNTAFSPGGVTPVNGATVTVPGLSPGPYRVETWDTNQGTLLGSRLLMARGGALTLPLDTLTADVAVKVARWSPSRRIC